MMMEANFDEQKAQEELKKRYSKAERLLKDKDKFERFLQRLEKKLKVIPLAGDKLAGVPIMASLVRSYAKKEYVDMPIGSIIAIISALIYFVSPIDIIPDVIPGIGLLDDAAVILACWKLVETDIEEYIKWREDNNKTLNKKRH